MRVIMGRLQWGRCYGAVLGGRAMAERVEVRFGFVGARGGRGGGLRMLVLCWLGLGGVGWVGWWVVVESEGSEEVKV